MVVKNVIGIVLKSIKNVENRIAMPGVNAGSATLRNAIKIVWKV